MSVKVHIFGVTLWKDVDMLIRFGADAVGFVVDVPPCGELVSISKAKGFIDKSRGKIKSVVLTISSDLNHILMLYDKLHPDMMQVTMDLSLDEMRKIKGAINGAVLIKTVSVVDDSAVEKALKYSGVCDMILLDSKFGKKLGATGKTHDWSISRKIVEKCSKPVILAGGLCPENVVEAIREVKPFAVDADTKLNLSLGMKDPDKVKIFIEKARSV